MLFRSINGHYEGAISGDVGATHAILACIDRRNRLLGIAIESATQIIYVDTPGIFAPRRRLDRAMVTAAWSGAADADENLLLVDAARGIDEDTRRILGALRDRGRRSILALNKIDLVRRDRLLGLELCEGGLDGAWGMIAPTGSGLPKTRAGRGRKALLVPRVA